METSMNKATVFSAPALLASLLLVGAAATAVPVAPGATVALPGTTVAAEPQLAGVVLEDVLTNFSFASTGGNMIVGQIQSRVVRSDLDGTLDFYWRVINLDDSNGAIGSFRI